MNVVCYYHDMAGLTPKHSVLNETEVAAFAREHRLDPYVLKRVRYLLLNERRPFTAVIQEIPSSLQALFAAEFQLELLERVSEQTSAIDGSSRIVFQTADGQRLETVVMRSPTGRTSLCVSSQVGCAMRCQFCATGRMGLRRDLTTAEIVAQVAQVNDGLRDEGRQVRNVVFMGMGEPLHNEEAVYGALERLISLHEFGISPQRIIVSTVGIAEAMIRLAKRFPRIGLAVSLHSVQDQLRQQLIPLARRYPLQLLREALHEAAAILQRPMMIEYLMLDGINDRLADAEQLAAYLTGLRVHVNLIPYNPIAAGPSGYRPTARPQRDRFAMILRDRGFLTTIRYSQGGDISAACGQLAS